MRHPSYVDFCRLFCVLMCSAASCATENAEPSNTSNSSFSDSAGLENTDTETAPDRSSEVADKSTQYRGGPSHLGVAPSGARLDKDLVLKWQTPSFGIGMYTASKSSPAVDAKRVYVGVDDGRLLALDIETGAVVWEYKTHRYVSEQEITGTMHLGIHGSPALDEGNVYIGDYDGYLYALDKATGGLVWERKLGGSIGASPTLFEGMIYIAVEFPAPEGKVFVVDAQTGQTLWSTPDLGNHPHSSVSIDEDGLQMFVGTNDGTLFSFDLKTRKLARRFETGAEIKSTAAVTEDTVYFTSWDEHLHAVAGEDGHERYFVSTADVSMSSPSVYDNIVVFGSHDSKIYAVGADSGAVRWIFDTDGAVLSSPTIVGEGRLVVVGSKDRKLYLIDLDDGILRQSMTLQSGISSVPTVVGNELFVNDDAGSVYCFTVTESVIPPG